MKPSKAKLILSFEKLVIVYVLITSLLIFMLWGRLEQPLQQLIGRLLIVVGMFVIGFVSSRYFDNNRLGLTLKVLFQLSLLNFWYPDIYYFNNAFSNLDHQFSILEQNIFSFQPSIVFSNMLPQKWFSEAIYFGYFAYYPLIVGSVAYSFFLSKFEVNRLMHMLLASFFLFYILYIFIPVAGPQFYFLAIGMEDVANENFYAVGDYFKSNTEIMAGPGYVGGFFYQLIHRIQSGGEFPIAAFPSSHVGISTVLMLWMSSVNRRVSSLLLPIYILLCCATVYIQAHYLIDVFAGWITGLMFYWLFDKLYIRKYTESGYQLT